MHLKLCNLAGLSVWSVEGGGVEAANNENEEQTEARRKVEAHKDGKGRSSPARQRQTRFGFGLVGF